jgi:hypothetical protein
MIRIRVKDEATRRWVDVPNGPFPVTREQLDEARRQFRAEWVAANADANPLAGIRLSPQTTARDILKKVAPHISDFDRGMIGFAVSNPKIAVEDAGE